MKAPPTSESASAPVLPVELPPHPLTATHSKTRPAPPPAKATPDEHVGPRVAGEALGTGAAPR
eukprot:8027545-Alexandrium_andersonii.AAC.1